MSAFDITKPADGADAATVDNEIRDNFEGIQKGDHWTAGSEPAYKEQGCAWYDSTDDIFKVYDGTIWQTWRLGSWAAKSNNTVYEAATDGLVVAYSAEATGATLNVIGYTDGSNPPTTVRNRGMMGSTYASATRVNVVFPVKKGDYWKVAGIGGGGAIYWIPFGV